MKKTATFSKCKKYRYELWRIWGKPQPFVLFVCLNPSIADHNQDSPTSKRCINFAQDWGYNALCMVNLFAFKSQDPKNLLNVSDPVGPDNDTWILNLSSKADLVVIAWGNKGKLNKRDEQIISLLSEPHYLDLNKNGCPRHPLYIPKDVMPKKWRNHEVAVTPKQRPIQQIGFMEDILLKDKNSVNKGKKLFPSISANLSNLGIADTISEQTFDKKIKFIDPPKSKNCGPLKTEGYVVFKYNGEKYQLSRHEHANQNNKNAVAVAINLKTGTTVNNLRSFLLEIIDEFDLKLRTHLISTPKKVRSNRELTKEIIRDSINFSKIFERHT